jgi:hypothetical protein
MATEAETAPEGGRTSELLGVRNPLGALGRARVKKTVPSAHVLIHDILRCG